MRRRHPRMGECRGGSATHTLGRSRVVRPHGTGPGRMAPCHYHGVLQGALDAEDASWAITKRADDDGAPAPRHAPQQYDVNCRRTTPGCEREWVRRPAWSPLPSSVRIRRTGVAPPHVLASPWRGGASTASSRLRDSVLRHF